MPDLLQDAMRDRATTLLLPLDRKQGLVLIAAPTWSAPLIDRDAVCCNALGR
jgi:hypothetical protein